MTAPVPTFAFLASFDGQLTGILTVGRSVVGGTDVVGGAFGGNTYDDITADVKDAVISMGRTGTFEPLNQATCTVRLADETGKYNPRNVGRPVNLCTNPSAETNTTGWGVATNGAASVTRQGAQAKYGAASFRLLAVSGTENDCRYNHTFEPNTEYTVSAWFYITTTGGGTPTLYINDGVDIYSASLNAAVTGAWQRVSVTFTTGAGPLGTAGAGTSYIDAPRCAYSLTENITIYTDGVLIQTGTLTDYVDGTMDGYRWIGTAHGSITWTDPPLRGKLVPMRPFYVTATDGTDTGQLFRGYIRKISYSPRAKEATLECVDLTEWLNMAKPVIAEVTNNTVDQIIGLILDSIQYTDPALRSLQTGGDIIPSWSADGSTSAADLIKALVATDFGLFYIDGGGVATYITRGAQHAPGSAVATLSGALVGSMDVEIDARNIINGQTCTRTGSTAQYEYSPDSQRDYGQRDGPVIDSANFGTDTEASGLARWVVERRKDARAPARKVELINRDATTLTQQLTRKINDLVAVPNFDGGTGINGRIQGIEYEVSDGQQVLRARYTVEEQLSISYLVVGTSTVGGADLVAAA